MGFSIQRFWDTLYIATGKSTEDADSDKLLRTVNVIASGLFAFWVSGKLIIRGFLNFL